MQPFPLTLPHIFRRAEELFSSKPIVSYDERGRSMTTYGAWAERTRRLGGVLDALEVAPGASVATLAWNSPRHLELYFGVPCAGRVLHTVNVRLLPEQIAAIIDSTADVALFVDKSLLALARRVLAHTHSVQHVIMMDDDEQPDGGQPDDGRPTHGGLPAVELLDYEELLDGTGPVDFDVQDEFATAAICHTSGTTGQPKGVAYTHRSTVLHTFGTMLADSFAIAERDVVLPMVPMFHANGWGIPHAAVAAGSTLVLPGSDLRASQLAEVIERERVTFSAGVPAVWTSLLPELVRRDSSSLRAVVGGGSAITRALSDAYLAGIGLPITQAWGMTETSPLCMVNIPRAAWDDSTDDERAERRRAIGYPILGIEARVVDPESPTDPVAIGTSGELQVRGPWIADRYVGETDDSQLCIDGWMRTGDVGRIDAEGYVVLVDRTKDLIKSGGEWIGSAELEGEIANHPAVAEVAVVAASSARWSERPLACVVLADDATLTLDELRDFLADRVPRWWLPDVLEAVDELPRTSVGKIDKARLRHAYAHIHLADA